MVIDIDVIQACISQLRSSVFEPSVIFVNSKNYYSFLQYRKNNNLLKRLKRIK